MRHLAIALAAAALAACGAAPPPPPPPQKTVIDAQLKALEKAKAVQDTVDQATQDRRKQVDDAGG
ncbi:hypothetical protein [Tahibacter soli]|jgi:hypothetical protein|uniref:Lipoprotein n=1 Tax=Tahibacter soli TaxID=2983605 RepID=A0A9X3YL90_9GAMM|nr:hypothetical protein [Tahibacter soli]MDC8013667.1 hypothetical protein [Tahibacter soli]